MIEDAPLGLHRAEDGELTALAHIGPANPAEFQDVISTTERLAADRRGDRRLGAPPRATDGGASIPRISAGLVARAGLRAATGSGSAAPKRRC